MPDPSIQAQIDAMAAGNFGRSVNPILAASNQSGDTTGNFEVRSDGEGGRELIQHSKPTAPPGRIPDRNINTQVEAQRLRDDITATQAKLDLFHYDAVTGQKVYNLEPGSPERQRIETLLDNQKKLAVHQLEIFRRLDAQRAQDAKDKEEDMVRELYVAGNPTKARLLDEALERKRAELVAERIIRNDIERASRGR